MNATTSPTINPSANFLSPTQLASYLDTLLQCGDFQDYCPNGLQVDGGQAIGHIVTGVSASQDLIEQAIQQQAQAIIVHHGYF